MARRRKYTLKPDGTAGMHNKDFYIATKRAHIDEGIKDLEVHTTHGMQKGQAIAMLHPKGL